MKHYLKLIYEWLWDEWEWDHEQIENHMELYQNEIETNYKNGVAPMECALNVHNCFI